MEKFIEDAIKKANAVNLMDDEAAEHISELFDACKISVLEGWRKSQPEEIVRLFCALFHPMPSGVLVHFVRLWEAFFVAGYWARNREALEEKAAEND